MKIVDKRFVLGGAVALGVITLVIFLAIHPTSGVVVAVAAVGLGVAANIITPLVKASYREIKIKVLGGRSMAREILEDTYHRLREVEEEHSQLVRFDYSYRQIVYSPQNLARVDRYMDVFEQRLVENSASDASNEECAIVMLFANYDKKIFRFFEKKFQTLSTPEYVILSRKAAQNLLFQKIVMVLSFERYFPDKATQIVESIHHSTRKTFSGELIADARNRVNRMAADSEDDDFIVSNVIGSEYSTSEMFSRLTKQINSATFYLNHPFILSRGALVRLESELLAPEIFKRACGFIKTSRNNYSIDFVRKVFEILINVEEIVRLANDRGRNKIGMYFYTESHPGLSVRLIKKIPYLYLLPGPPDIAKFLNTFHTELTNRELVNMFYEAIRPGHTKNEKTIRDARDLGIDESNIRRFDRGIEQFELTDHNLSELWNQSMKELCVYLKRNNITKADLTESYPRILTSITRYPEKVSQFHKKLADLYGN